METIGACLIGFGVVLLIARVLIVPRGGRLLPPVDRKWWRRHNSALW